jgi:hypothetical protein
MEHFHKHYPNGSLVEQPDCSARIINIPQGYSGIQKTKIPLLKIWRRNCKISHESVEGVHESFPTFDRIEH